jgi:hypothetical protein
MSETEPKLHLNVGGPRGWTTACGIESASFVDEHESEDVDCKRCLKAMEKRPVAVDHGEAMTLEEAKAHCKAGGSAYPLWFGKGWCMVWHTFPQKSQGETRDGDFFDRNPVTGSLLLHRFGDRDECEWFKGQQPEELKFDD